MTQNSILITGAAQGIGFECANYLAKQGYHVLATDVQEQLGQDKYQDISNVTFMRCDVTDAESIQDVMRFYDDDHFQLVGLVSNAGIVHSASFLELNEKDYDRVIDINLKGMFLVGQAVAKYMVAHKVEGAIVNMSSVNGTMAIPDQVPYVVSKGGINQLTKVMALSLAPHNIRVNAIGPGSIMTEMLQAVAHNPTAMTKIMSRTPLGRCGEPIEIAQIAGFLLGQESSYITGQILYADGGRLALNYTMPVAS